jgi:hypothetical protein
VPRASADSEQVELLATCLAGEAGLRPVADHQAILGVLHRLAAKRRQSVERVTRGHCNAAVSARGTARVADLRARFPQHWEALVQVVEAFDPSAPTCNAVTWAGPETDRTVIAAKKASGELGPVVRCGETVNVFYGERL